MEQFPSQPWKGADPEEGNDPKQPLQEDVLLEEPFLEPTFVDIPEDIRDAFNSLQKKAQQTELPEIRIEE